MKTLINFKLDQPTHRWVYRMVQCTGTIASISSYDTPAIPKIIKIQNQLQIRGCDCSNASNRTFMQLVNVYSSS